MANEFKGGRRLAGSRPVQPYTPSSASNTGDLDATIVIPGGSKPAAGVDDVVVDDILRSISEQSSTPVPAPRQTVQAPDAQPAVPSAEDATAVHRPARENEYEAAASAMRRRAAVQSQNTVPPSDPYNMRDPAQTQSFRPARPAHRDTDRLPTLVDEKPVRRKTALSKVLTFLVVILVIAALVLGARMVYILGPSLGWNLPDLSKIPGVSTVLGLVPDPEEQIADPVEPSTEPEVQVQDPTSVTLDAAEIELHSGESVVLTASLDVEGWDGLLAWASSDKTESIVKMTQLGPTTVQVDYVGEGECAIAVMAGVKPADGSDAPSASCIVYCVADEETQEPDETDTEPVDEPTGGEHIDIVLRKDDFTLNVGESYQVMGENADQVTWSTSNADVATVSESGVVSAVGKGTATITATGPDGATASAIARVR